MITDTVTIRFDVHADDSHQRDREAEVPAWMSEEPRLAAALYLFGHSGAVPFIWNARVVNEPLHTPHNEA